MGLSGPIIGFFIRFVSWIQSPIGQKGFTIPIRGTHPVLAPVVLLQVARHAGTMSRAAQIVESVLRLKAGASTEVYNMRP